MIAGLMLCASAGAVLADCPLPALPAPLNGQPALLDAAGHASGTNLLSGRVMLRLDGVASARATQKAIGVGEGDVFALVGSIARLRRLDDQTEHEIGAGTAFNEITLVGALRVAERTSGPTPFLYCYRFEPLAPDQWSDLGLDPPTTEGVVFRLFDDARSDFDASDGAVAVTTAQNGHLLYEFGFTAPGQTEGEGADARPATYADRIRNFKFLERSTLRVGASVLAPMLHRRGTALLPVGIARPLFGSPSDAQLVLDGWQAATVPPGSDWDTAGKIALTLRLSAD